ncbi:bifunctional diaminohydroxyphosphoribosylaminopyrimidine deaminase/5-amino-6-(5-phosphoribosylamino)uracil reductase RibD [Bdellovibrio reynosensis]|uniref:Riboflavin biosynthesis protein RibD n=1 Tax=Bdellovibrio reynosensis TaxID=2835041 RepID=A0ABY4C8D3_9BACT|nr:bifunctional diaminohydroxyphosphoribosylaminopyrimidine deaminase/5-amino-6-(5-phosphoribosylamino)uracil reductase RibD [Bdellovibrio reynosensis]UOF00734.1 bifunctional diaminohydroxyphosphoribosylaminopyrimidine deaminase/5-amino-6-(5-phosphoribosylamino)uracil reductase RibD [Bdellovibrio reynosensis]
MEHIHHIKPPARGTKLSPESAMRLAISEAYKGATRVSPNPLVGSVVLDANGGFLSSGYHEFYGGPHAEVNALKNLSNEELRDAHVFVTLEPCAHEGKTPSCAKMMAKLPLKKVTFGLIDPNPLVAGQGADILRAAGIETEVFSSSDGKEDHEIKIKLEEVCETFLWNFREKKVFVALKMASSLDGQVALKSGESQWITGPESREYVHYIRACYDAVLVGKGTVQFDNPSLNIRHPELDKRNKVVVLDAEADLLYKYSELKLSQVHASGDVFWCVAEDLKEDVTKKLSSLALAPKVLFIKTLVGGELDLENLLAQLYVQGLRSVMVEGGAFTASSFVNYQLVNRLYLFQAPMIMGSGGSRSWTETLRIPTMKEKIHMKNPRYLTFGTDFMVTGTF